MTKDLIATAGCLAALLPGALVAGCNSHSTSAASAAVPLPMGGNISGKLADIDYSSHHLTIQAANGATYQVNASHAPVLLNGRKAAFADLSPGTSASVIAIAMDQKTMEIEAREVNAAAPRSHVEAVVSSSQPVKSEELNASTAKPTQAQRTKLTTAVAGEGSAAPRPPALRSRLPEQHQIIDQNRTDTTHVPPAVVQPTVIPQQPAVPAHSHHSQHSSNDASLAGTGGAAGDGTPDAPQDEPGGRRHTHPLHRDENGSQGAWTVRENRKGREREWGAEAQQMHSNNTEAPHSSRQHGRDNGNDAGSEDSHLSPAERRDLQRGEQEIERSADN